VKAGIVGAVLSAGYQVKLAGGGYYNAAALRSRVTEIQANIPEGVGIRSTRFISTRVNSDSNSPYALKRATG